MEAAFLKIFSALKSLLTSLFQREGRPKQFWLNFGAIALTLHPGYNIRRKK